MNVDELIKILNEYKNLTTEENQNVNICVYLGEDIGHLFPEISNIGFNETGIIIDAKFNNSDMEFIAKSKDKNTDGAFGQFCREEAEFRLLELDILDNEEKEKVKNLSKEELENLIDNIAESFSNNDILDYDYMDDLLRTEIEDFKNN